MFHLQFLFFFLSLGFTLEEFKPTDKAPEMFCPSCSSCPSSETSVWLGSSNFVRARGHRRYHIFQVPAVLELEAAMHQLLRQRASRLVQRRQDDIKDESSEFASLSSQSILKVFKIYLNGPCLTRVCLCAVRLSSLWVLVKVNWGG